jgi:lipopolysaccharide transport system permease protein
MSDRSELKRYVSLTLALAAREFPGAYRGNLSGALGSILVPVAMLATYSLVFSRLIPVGVGPDRSGSGYVFFLFGGLIVWNLFSDVVVRAPSLFRAAPHFVRRPRFPLSIIVLAPCLASFYRSLPWLGVYLVAHVVVRGGADWSMMASVAVLGATALLTVGVALLLAVAGVLVRDLAELTPPVVTLLFFLSPILYDAERLAEMHPWILELNPIAGVIQAMRATLLDQTLPSAELIARIGATGVIWLILGVVSYRAIRRALPDLV